MSTGMASLSEIKDAGRSGQEVWFRRCYTLFEMCRGFSKLPLTHSWGSWHSSGSILASSLLVRYVLNTFTGERARRPNRPPPRQPPGRSPRGTARGNCRYCRFEEYFTGHTIYDPAHPIMLESITFLPRLLTWLLSQRPSVDQKMGTAIQRLSEEDPWTFRVVQRGNQPNYHLRHG